MKKSIFCICMCAPVSECWRCSPTVWSKLNWAISFVQNKKHKLSSNEKKIFNQPLLHIQFMYYYVQLRIFSNQYSSVNLTTGFLEKEHRCWNIFNQRHNQFNCNHLITFSNQYYILQSIFQHLESSKEIHGRFVGGFLTSLVWSLRTLSKLESNFITPSIDTLRFQMRFEKYFTLNEVKLKFNFLSVSRPRSPHLLLAITSSNWKTPGKFKCEVL